MSKYWYEEHVWTHVELEVRTGRSEGQDVQVSDAPEQEAQSGWHASQVELDEAKKPVPQEEVQVPLRRYCPEAQDAQYVVEREQVAQAESHAAGREAKTGQRARLRSQGRNGKEGSLWQEAESVKPTEPVGQDAMQSPSLSQ